MQRKKYSQEFEKQVVKESLEVGNAAIVARKHDLSANMVSRWVREHKNQNNIGFSHVHATTGSYNQSAKALESENEQLKKLLGEKDLEIAILRDLVKKTTPQFKIK